MVIPVDEPEEDVQEEVEEVVSTSLKAKDKSKFDFAVEDTDRTGLIIYTVSTKPAEEDWQTLTIVAPDYGAALEMAGIDKGNTIKVSEAIFEG